MEAQEGLEDVKAEVKPATGEVSPILSFLFENQKVEKETFVGPVSVGDVIKIQFAGLEKEDRFQDYGKKFNSKWKEKICRREGSLEPGIGFKVFTSCDNEFTKRGPCTAYYKKHLDKKETRLHFEKKLKDIPLRFRLGKNFYTIGNIEKHGGHFIEASLEVEKGMLQGSRELYLRPLHKIKGKVKTGFQHLSSDCAGRGKKGFHFPGPKASSYVEHEVRRELYVDLQILKQNSLSKEDVKRTPSQTINPTEED